MANPAHDQAILHAVHDINNLYKNNKTVIHVDTLKTVILCLAIVMTTATALLAKMASS